MGRRGHYQAPETGTRSDEAGQRECSRGDWCSEPRLTRENDGTFARSPALTPRAFCTADRSAIIAALEALPYAYHRLGDALGDPPKGSTSGARMPFGPSEPLRAEVDALMRLIAAILPGWEARTRAVASWTPRDPQRDPLAPASVTDAAATLGKLIDVLLTLPHGWTTRVWTFPSGRPRPHAGLNGTCRRCGRDITLSTASGCWWAADEAGPAAVACGHEPVTTTEVHTRLAIPADIEAEIGDEEIVRIGEGWVKVTTRRDGAQAGLEILDLHYRARRILGETRSAPETFDGIPCRNCENMALERAEPPSSPTLPAMHSRCATCGHTMDRKTFTEWAAWYAGWASRLDLACRRCQRDNHDTCTWGKCSCAAQGHAA